MHNISIAPPVLSDNSVITVSIKFSMGNHDPDSSSFMYKYHQADLEKAHNIFQIWREKIVSAIILQNPIDEVYSIFVKSLFKLRDDCALKIKIGSQGGGPLG